MLTFMRPLAQYGLQGQRVGFIGPRSGSAPHGGFETSYAIPAGTSNTLATDTIACAGFSEFMLIATVTLAAAELRVLHMDPENPGTVLQTTVVGNMGPATNVLQTFGAGDSQPVLVDHVFCFIRLEWRNTSGAAISTVSNPRLWAYAR